MLVNHLILFDNKKWNRQEKNSLQADITWYVNQSKGSIAELVGGITQMIIEFDLCCRSSSWYSSSEWNNVVYNKHGDLKHINSYK